MRRNCVSFVLVSALAACGGNGSDMPGDATVTPDSNTIDPPARGFQIISKDVTIPPGEEHTYCYYFRTPNTEPMVIKSWHSVMAPGSHHMIMFTTGQTDKMPPGTVSEAGCGLTAQGTNVPVWTYAAQNPDTTVDLPADDGTGKPLGQEIPANTAGFFQMHYLNSTDAPLVVHVTLNANAYEAGAPYTRTEAFITFNGNISIAPHATGVVAAQTCNAPAGAKFWMLSTHAHKQAVKTEVVNGAANGTDVAFSSTNWEHPGAMMFAAPFYSFSSGQFTYRCTYDNTGDNANNTVTTGDSAATDEMCMGTGYYFPATKPLFCYNNLGPF